jgi:hypothetical protein
MCFDVYAEDPRRRGGDGGLSRLRIDRLADALTGSARMERFCAPVRRGAPRILREPL